MSKRLYVGNLAFSTTEESLRTLFSQFGEVDSCRLITDRDNGRSKGFAFVEMTETEAADQAISQLDGKDHEGRTIKVNEAKPQESRSGGEGSGRGGFSRDRNSSGGRRFGRR